MNWAFNAFISLAAAAAASRMTSECSSSSLKRASQTGQRCVLGVFASFPKSRYCSSAQLSLLLTALARRRFSRNCDPPGRGRRFKVHNAASWHSSASATYSYAPVNRDTTCIRNSQLRFDGAFLDVLSAETDALGGDQWRAHSSAYFRTCASQPTSGRSRARRARESHPPLCSRCVYR